MCLGAPIITARRYTSAVYVVVGHGSDEIKRLFFAISQKRSNIKTELLWEANKNSYALYRMTLFPVILGDSNYPNHPILYILHCLSYLCNG